uniref:Uncharacterized protein n=1 Tax=Rhizophora mucronata TaxID=61149 RepID=A0A2P2N930_RHIMU
MLHLLKLPELVIIFVYFLFSCLLWPVDCKIRCKH